MFPIFHFLYLPFLLSVEPCVLSWCLLQGYYLKWTHHICTEHMRLFLKGRLILFIYLFLSFILLSYIASGLQFPLPPLYPVSPSNSPLPQIHSFSLSLQNKIHQKLAKIRARIQEIATKHGLIMYNKTQHRPSYQDWMRQSSEMKRFWTQAKESGTPLFLLLESHKSTKIHNRKVYAEDLSQTRTGSVFVAFVSMSPMDLLCWFCVLEHMYL